MKHNFESSLKLVLKHEGGWADHPKDPGGATMKGITIAVYRENINPKGAKEDLRKITDAQVAQIYRSQYWDKVRGDDLPSGVDYAVFDYAVNSGVSRASKHLQGVVGKRQDGKIGPETLAATNAMLAPSVINNLCDRRMVFLRNLKTFPTFGKGWTSRVSGVRAEALKMVSADIKPVAPKPASSPAAAPAKPSSNPAPAVAGIMAAILAAAAYVANVPCEWLGVLCG